MPVPPQPQMTEREWVKAGMAIKDEVGESDIRSGTNEGTGRLTQGT